jgi:hypothetical protein
LFNFRWWKNLKSTALRAPITKSYMWVCRGGPPGKLGVLYHYDPTRSSEVAKLLVQGYAGVVQTDGYAGYDFLDNSSFWCARRSLADLVS